MVIPELKYVDFECRDQIGWITMNHPEKMNALTFEMAESLTKILNLCSDPAGSKWQFLRRRRYQRNESQSRAWLYRNQAGLKKK